MRKAIITGLLVTFLMALPASAEEENFFKENGFEEIKATAYCCGEITANGSPVHYGGMASTQEHMGDVAILYTLDGEYIGTFECNDLGGTDAIHEGYVIDVYHPTYEECKDFMRLTGGKVYVKYIDGVG